MGLPPRGVSNHVALLERLSPQGSMNFLQAGAGLSPTEFRHPGLAHSGTVLIEQPSRTPPSSLKKAGESATPVSSHS